MATKSKKNPFKNLSKVAFIFLAIIIVTLSFSNILLKTLPWAKIIGKTMIAIGCFIIISTIFLTQLSYITPVKSAVVLNKTNTSNIYPSSIEIKNITHQLKLEQGYYRYDLWSLSDDFPMYLDASGTPGKPGNIIIYGHDSPKIFGNLNQVKTESEVLLKTSNDSTLTYKIDSIKIVLPTDVEILKQGSEERITLFTCTGLFDSMRLVVSGKRTT